MKNKERAERLEAMVDRMSETIVDANAKIFYLTEREQMAIILLRYCKPHVEAMVGVASSARGVPEMIDKFMDGTLKFEDA